MYLITFTPGQRGAHMHAFINLQDMWRHIQGTNAHNEKQVRTHTHTHKHNDSYTLAHTHPNIYTHCEENSGDEAVAVELGLKVF